jgi:hypothetical protein
VVDGEFSLVDRTYKNPNQMISKGKRAWSNIQHSTVFFVDRS